MRPREVTKLPPDLCAMIMEANKVPGDAVFHTGDIPAPHVTVEPPKHFPAGTPDKDILEAMEKRAMFTMDVDLREILKGDVEEKAKLDAQRIARKLENKNRW